MLVNCCWLNVEAFVDVPHPMRANVVLVAEEQRREDGADCRRVV